MKHVTRIGIALFVYLTTVLVIHFLKQRDAAHVAQEVAATAKLEASRPVTEQDRAQWRKTEERIQLLMRMEERRAKLERAAAETRNSRRHLQLARVGVWSSLIRTNMAHYHDLYSEARNQTSRQVECSICDGLSYMPCIMCPEKKGKCSSCNGTGRHEGDEFCPSCTGTAKCYLCAGSGKMFCPFCDDGMIRVDWPLPHYFPPAE